MKAWQHFGNRKSASHYKWCNWCKNGRVFV